MHRHHASAHRGSLAGALLTALVLTGPVASLGLVQAAQDDALQADPILGEPLVINGKVVPFERIRREIVFGSLGTEVLQMAQLRIMTEEEMNRQIEDGADPKKFEVTDEDVQAAIGEAETQVQKAYEGQGTTLEELYPVRDEAWLDNVRLTQLFNRVFLPEDPRDYPPITREALEEQKGQNGETLYQNLVAQYEQRLANPDQEQDQFSKGMLAMIINNTVINYVKKNAEIVEDPDKLPAGVACRVNGKDVLIEDVWQRIKDRVTPVEVEKAKRWIVNTTLLENSLRESGHWLDDETFEKRYEEYTAPYKDSPFSIEAVALRFQRFPTIDKYKTYWRIGESMKDRIRSDMREAVLRRDGEEIEKEAKEKAQRLVDEGSDKDLESLTREIHEEIVQDYVDRRWEEQLRRTSMTRTSKLAGDARVQVDVILVSAYDFAKKRWKENGWEEAEKRTKRLVQDLADGLPWKDAVEKYSEFYDPPVPTGQAQPSQAKNKGRFRAISRNELMKQLDETVYTAFVYGESLADYIFFEMDSGEVQDPIKGPFGYYVPLLYSRGGPKRVLDIENPDHRELIVQDLVNIRTYDLLGKLIAENEIRGIS